MSILTVSFFTLQGQLLDMREEMNDMKEESEDESEDETTATDESVVKVSCTEKSISVDKDITDKATKPNTFTMEDVEYWANKETDKSARVTEFRIEDLEYWANKGKRIESEREISIEDLERWGKHRKYNKLNSELKCEVCNYGCKKSSTMKKHMNTKHGGTSL